MALRLACICLWLTSLAALPGRPAEAQSAVQSVYGSRPARAYGYPSLSPYRSSYGWRPYSRYQPYEETEEVHPHERGGTVRTLCVRLCDGFYFPISSATTRSELARDADKCSAVCSAEAQLFYHSTIGGGIDTMVDLTGRAYSSFPNAFKYRKALVPGCRCRPQPWSEAERRRHRSYEGDAAVAEGKPAAEPGDGRALEAPDTTDDVLPRRAGGDDAGVTVITSDRLVSRPQTVERQTQGPPLSWYPGPRRWGTSPYR